ncbi:upstream stimulatory factor 2-like [Zonotrichia albicollis]|uniref:upstream stimulatory factor 2-like n=1 Tax=Zonotrichia albicollis TaxID=44394 RepID=UPI003D80E7FD
MALWGKWLGYTWAHLGTPGVGSSAPEVPPGVPRCAQVYPSCAQVCPGAPRCAQVCPGVPAVSPVPPPRAVLCDDVTAGRAAGGGRGRARPRPHGHAPHGPGHAYSPKLEGPRVPRDERRRAQHNEVERRRRDKINNWIVQLSKIIPDCGADSGKSGASKGGILSKACDYVRELRQSNQRLQETFKEAERLQMDNDLLRQQLEELKSEHAVLRAQLQQRGLDGTPEATPP